MKILIVNTYDYGGAANACKRLHLGLLEAGVDSKVLLKNKYNDWPESYQFEPVESQLSISGKLKRKLRRLAQELKLYKRKDKISFEEDFLRQRSEVLEMFSFPQSLFDITQSPLYKEADIINMHWVANFLDFESFFLKNTKPVVWTLHDMNPFTGGEHYEEKFLGMDRYGEPLERKYSGQEVEVNKINTALKKQSLAKSDNFHIVAPSKWLVQEAGNSEVFEGQTIKHIPNALDPQIFKPSNKTYSRELLNIPEGKKMVLFVADSLKNNRKGYIFLKEAFKRLNNKDILLCAIGNKSSEIDSENIIELGPVKDERFMSVVYSAADVFVIPSLMDNLPNTVLESLMCGTPVIGFPIGGIPDMIENGKNGLLTSKISVEALVHSLDEFLKMGVSLIGEQIRADAIKKYDYKIQAKEYRKLFDDIIIKTEKGS